MSTKAVQYSISSPLDMTIAIPVKNEERNLLKCLNSIGENFAKKIVVIDSGSSDNTRAIAEGFGAEVIDFKWNGKFPKKRNWFLINHTPLTKWVFFLDADEYLTDKFKKEVQQSLAKNDNVGYWLTYSIYFLGEKLKGGYPLKKLALFQVGSGLYEQIDEEKWSQLDMEVHEHPILFGKTSQIKSKIDHNDFRGVSHYVIKHNEYASWEAERFIRTIKNKNSGQKWTFKQRLKYKLIKSPFIGPAFFLGSYIFLGGFRDGTRGLAFAILKMSYFNQVYCKIREINGKL